VPRDYVELTEHDGSSSMAVGCVLNPGGVRIGTAEIYRQVERLDEVVESSRSAGLMNDVRVVLFVRLREASRSTTPSPIAYASTFAKTPRRGMSGPRGPVTGHTAHEKAAKSSSSRLRNVVHGKPVKNVDALANPSPRAVSKPRNSERTPPAGHLFASWR